MRDKPLISFDYAIKYLLRHKKNHDIIEEFISVLLATRGYQPVKINASLESESNPEMQHLNRSVVDLGVQNDVIHQK